MKRLRIEEVLLAQVFILLFYAAAQATTITFEVEDFSQTSIEGIPADLWQYTSDASDFVLDKDDRSTIYGLIQDLSEVTTAKSQWRQITWDSDVGIPVSGVYDAPVYDVYDSVYASLGGAGMVSPSEKIPFPEPATVLLLGTGLLGLAGLIRRGKSH